MDLCCASYSEMDIPGRSTVSLARELRIYEALAGLVDVSVLRREQRELGVLDTSSEVIRVRTSSERL